MESLHRILSEHPFFADMASHHLETIAGRAKNVRFDARAMEVTRAIAIDGQCLRDKEENDHEPGHILMKHFAQIMQQMRQATRLHLIDMYRNPVVAES
jgi:hypothetical protein